MTRVLFVDDEPRVLEGLRLGLRRKRKVWDLVFFETAAAALADIAQTPVDVVVSDMRMPDMDGAEFLARVAALRPEAARIVLSGQMDESAAVRAASIAHRFLSKPCEAHVLESVIGQAVELHDSAMSDALRRRIGGVESLPSLPQAYLALNKAMADSDVSMAAVARIIESDPGMAAKILQLVNSSFFGLPRKVVNISQAASLLGINTMKNLTLASSLFHELGASDLQAAERERERSLLRSRIVRRFFTDSARAESAASAALLLHVGTLTLQSRLPSEHAANIAESKERNLPIHEIEQQRFGITHAEIGAYLLGLWGLPDEIVVAVANHHAPWDDAPTLDVATGVRVADGLTCSILSECSSDLDQALPAELLGALELREIVARVRDEVSSTISKGKR